MTKFEELLKKYNKTVEDITFEYEGLSDEELEEVFSTTFGESEPTPDTVLTESDKSDDDTDDDTDDSTIQMSQTTLITQMMIRTKIHILRLLNYHMKMYVLHYISS